ncbi:epimerase [Echinicola pacifica]|uniref:Epimerase n=1 Tax=Echinicola pacifica TaxID=346377 RepID=A0A918QB50_9BACT|nr:SDR family oxidoreductase [Echinicola pacifica]GGZ37802.1 epimerase [Echinicola pacifica]
MPYKLTGQKVLVTGGAGFIGSNLIDTLLESGNQVVCLDNFSTGKLENLDQAMRSEHFTLIKGDIRNFEDCAEAVEGCDYVFHQAALGSVPRSIADPMTSTDVNIGGFVKVLFAAKQAGVKRVIYAASSSTYGDHPDLPKVEHKIGKSLSPYAITKYVDELFAQNFAMVYGLETIGLRYFNVFGSRQDPNGAYAAVIPKFASQLIEKSSPKINGDGTFSRDFTYIDNVIQANIKCAEISTADLTEQLDQYYAEIKEPKPFGDTICEVLNVACGDRTNLNQLVDALKQGLSKYDAAISAVEVDYGPERPGDVPHSLASIAKSNKAVGYDPSITVEEGILKACDWYWEKLKKES